MGFGNKAGWGATPTVCEIELSYEADQGEAQELEQEAPTYTVVVS